MPLLCHKMSLIRSDLVTFCHISLADAIVTEIIQYRNEKSIDLSRTWYIGQLCCKSSYMPPDIHLEYEFCYFSDFQTYLQYKQKMYKSCVLLIVLDMGK